MVWHIFSFVSLLKHSSRPDLTSPLAPQVQVIGRGPAESDMYFDGQNCGAQSFDNILVSRSLTYWFNFNLWQTGSFDGLESKLMGKKKFRLWTPKKKGWGGGRSNLKIIKRNFKIPCKRHQIQKNQHYQFLISSLESLSIMPNTTNIEKQMM